jgi:hypothetical protein
MRVSREFRLDQVLANSLPGWALVAEGRGHWHTAAGQAEWELEPADSGFWLVLWASLESWRLSPSPLAQAGEWPWPLKLFRREPGSEFLWSAEIRLDGKPGEAQRIQALVDTIDAWLSEWDGQRTPSTGGPHDEANSYPPPEGEDMIVRALGSSLKRTARGFRLPSQDGSAVAINASRDGWILRTTLVRGAEMLSPGGSACLDDFMAVANGRLRGCRGFHEKRGSRASVALESRVSCDSLTVNTIRGAVDSLLESACRVAAACQVLVEQPAVGELYRELLIGKREGSTEVQD